MRFWVETLLQTGGCCISIVFVHLSRPQVTDVQMLEYNGVWPTDPFILGRKLTQRLAPELSKPVRFEYINGRVGKVFAPANLPEDILNIHRGILNIFQITIKKAQNFYELQEAGIEGVCRTNYIVQEDKKANRITVTKSKDLNNCQEKVMLFTGAAYASHCPAFQEVTLTSDVRYPQMLMVTTMFFSHRQRGRNIRASVTFTHVLKPTAAGAILQEAKVREVHQFTPFHELDGTAIIEARQSLVLVDVKSAAFVMPHEVFIQRGTMKYRYHQGVLHKPLQLSRPQNVEKAVISALYSVWGNKWCWILFALPAVGTADALRFITTKIQRLEVTMQEAARTLALALHQVTADLHTLRLVTVGPLLLCFSHLQGRWGVTAGGAAAWQRHRPGINPHLGCCLCGACMFSTAERMEQLDLYTLEFRRMRGVLIETYKIIKGLDTLEAGNMFPMVHKKAELLGVIHVQQSAILRPIIVLGYGSM
ncbi:vitellogenin-like, partial [Leucoraja erinacea]|uniref:vitellogenin-like n=1 Tax=Leucoraja erinaceus TaxID=7782 RepID=UPI002453AC82